MDGLFDTGISIEKLAAFMDGNLMPDEMSEISSVIDGNGDMRGFIEQSNAVDDTISMFTEEDLELPDELQTGNFELPSLVNNDFGHDILSPEGFMNEADLLACCCSLDGETGSLVSGMEHNDYVDGESSVEMDDTDLSANIEHGGEIDIDNF